VVNQFDSPDVDPKLIAQAQFLRWRRRLGKLTPEQQSRVEDLITSTAVEISTLARRELAKIISHQNAGLDFMPKTLNSAGVQSI
jgi:hypothetical protein